MKQIELGLYFNKEKTPRVHHFEMICNNAYQMYKGNIIGHVHKINGEQVEQGLDMVQPSLCYILELY